MASSGKKTGSKDSGFAGLNSKKLSNAWGKPDRSSTPYTTKIDKPAYRYTRKTDEKEGKGQQKQELEKKSFRVDEFGYPDEADMYEHMRVPLRWMLTLQDAMMPNPARRIVARYWERREGAKKIEGDDWRPGKRTSNNFPTWGATLLDFWRFDRFPDVAYTRVASSSEIVNSLKHMGEYDPEDTKFIWASQEEDPAIVLPVDVGKKIERFESMVIEEKIGLSVSDYKKAEKAEKKKKKKGKKVSYNTATEMDIDENSYIIPTDSPFHPSKYSGRWPLVPFSASEHVPLLQHRIPLDELPETLIVHDPWNLLRVTGEISGEEANKQWMEKQDIVHRYKLHRNSKPEEKDDEPMSVDPDPENDDEDDTDPYLLSEDEYRFVMRGDLFNLYSEDFGKPILVKCPPKPPRRRGPSEAHLYISPAHVVGSGHHSFVYKAELELPRSKLIESEICDDCLEQVVQMFGDHYQYDLDKHYTNLTFQENAPKAEEIRREEEEKRERRMTSKAKGKQREEDSTSEEEDMVITDANGKKFDVPRRSHKTAANIRMYDRFTPGVMVHTYPPDQYAKVEEAERKGKKPPKGRHETEWKAPQMERVADYNGRVYELDLSEHPMIQWQSPDLTGPEYCSHLSAQRGKDKRLPQTATVSVVAKLSIQHDQHLAREADNYTRYPSHFFEDWNGFMLVDHTVGPVPVHPVVPQFYGYYLPEGESAEKTDYYLSPIMLLENCGQQIDPEKLDMDDKLECVSLLQRFHIEGWRHGSVALRNFVCQQGRPSESPEHVDGTRSFRLIDFGRSFKYDDPMAKELEAKGFQTDAYSEQLYMKTLFGYASDLHSWTGLS